MSEKERTLIAVIGDENTVTGMLLAGVGNIDARQNKNFLIVDSKTSISEIEDAFKNFIARKDIAIIMINQHVADEIRYLVDEQNAPFPAVLEIPSKEHAYDPEKDSVLRRVNKLFSTD